MNHIIQVFESVLFGKPSNNWTTASFITSWPRWLVHGVYIHDQAAISVTFYRSQTLRIATKLCLKVNIKMKYLNISSQAVGLDL